MEKMKKNKTTITKKTSNERNRKYNESKISRIVHFAILLTVFTLKNCMYTKRKRNQTVKTDIDNMLQCFMYHRANIAHRCAPQCPNRWNLPKSLHTYLIVWGCSRPFIFIITLLTFVNMKWNEKKTRNEKTIWSFVIYRMSQPFTMREIYCYLYECIMWCLMPDAHQMAVNTVTKKKRNTQ